MKPSNLGIVLWLAAVFPAGARPADDKPALDPETNFSVAMTHLREGRVDMALEGILQSIKQDAKNPYFHKGLGLAYMRKADLVPAGERRLELLGKAVEALRKALEINPYYVDVHNDLGTALMFSGKREEGKKEFLTAFNDPTYPTPEVAARNLGQVFLEEKNFSEAYNWFTTSVQRNKRYADAYLGLADALVGLGRPEEAVTQLEGANRQIPDSIPLRFALGDASFRAGRFHEARAYLEEVARKDPGGPQGRQALELLRSLPK